MDGRHRHRLVSIGSENGGLASVIKGGLGGPSLVVWHFDSAAAWELSVLSSV